MTPCEQSEDPVLWHRRDFNRIADFAVNHTMDYKRSWLHNFKCPVVNFRTSEANYVCHSDGGTRANSCSGAAWIIEARVVRNDHRHVSLLQWPVFSCKILFHHSWPKPSPSKRQSIFWASICVKLAHTFLTPPPGSKKLAHTFSRTSSLPSL